VKSLTSKQSEQLSDLQEKLQSASQKVESAVADFNSNVSELWNNLVLESLNDYNNLVEQAKEFVEDRSEQMQSFCDDKSEKGRESFRGESSPRNVSQQSEKGEAFQEWLNAWEEAESELEEIDLTMPVEVDTPNFLAVEAMDALSVEPSL